MRRVTPIILLAALLVASSGCLVTDLVAKVPTPHLPARSSATLTPAPPPDAIGQIAISGRQFIIACDATVTGLDKAMTAGVVPPSVGVTVLLALQKIGTEAGYFAQSLKIIDQTTDHGAKTDAVTKAQASMQIMQLAIDEALVTIVDPKVRAVIDGLLAAATAELRDFGPQLAAVAASLRGQPVAAPIAPPIPLAAGGK